MNSLKTSIRPEDILSDQENIANLNGVAVRKGSIAAFLQNINIIENPEYSLEQKAVAIKMMEELAPALIASGLYKHATFKNPQVQKILEKENNM